MRYPLLIPVLFAFHAIGCQAPAPGPGTQVPAQPAPATVDTKELDSQLLGDSLLRVLGPVQDLVVADLFAGKGYYTWKLLGAGARVLAIAQDQQDVAALEARKKQEGIGDDRLLIRLTTPGNPGLQPGEADIALVTREFSTLGDRKAWLGQLKAGLRPPYKFMLVNYLPGASPFGPPLSERMDFNTVADEISENGFSDVSIFYKQMPYRYIIYALDPPAEEE